LFKIRLAFGVVFLLFVQFYACLVFAQETPDSELTWLTNFEDAQNRAEEDGKFILTYFSGSDWCRPCMQLRLEVFETHAFRTFANENFILVQFDFPARKANQLPKKQKVYNERMAEKYDSRGAFPLVVIVDHQGEKIGEASGYNREGVEAYLNKLRRLINEQ
jgi:thioredoxin-related protein